MKLSLILGVVGLSLSLAPAHAFAQSKDAPHSNKAAAGAIDPAAADFIEKYRAAIRSMTDFSATVMQATKSTKSDVTQSGDLLIALDHSAEGPAVIKQFRISSKADDLDATWAFDGKTASKIDRAAKTFESMKVKKGQAFPVQEVANVVPSWSRGTDVLNNNGAKLAAAKFLPDAEIDGVKCRVVEYRVEVTIPDDQVERSDDDKGKSDEPLKMVTEQVRHVGAADLMPRKIESKVFYTGPFKETPAGLTFKGVYSNVKVNAKPKDDAFVLAAPAGFKTIEADEPDLGIPSDKSPKLKFVAGQTAPEFALKTPDGTEVTLASLKGRVVLLDFWATWCGPCKMAMPGVQSLHEKYQGKPVSIFGVDTFEPGAGDKAAKYMQEKKYTYGLLLEGDSLAKKYGIGSIPTFVLIGRDGKVIYTGVGFHQGHEKDVAEMIDKALPGA
jgi:thiol-disulfide isomerase/thioredoxin